MNAAVHDFAPQLASLGPEALAFVQWQLRWLETARLGQLPPDPGEQAEWLEAMGEAAVCSHPNEPWIEYGVQAGRGYGKTRIGAEWLGKVAWECTQSLPYTVIAPTQSDVRLTCFEGESGLLGIIPPECVEDYNRGELILKLSNGAMVRGFSAEKADRLRGPQHASVWCFVAGTMVATPTGERAIETLRPGDTVLTRKGPRRVQANAKRQAQVGRVVFSHGRELLGTTDHPVYTARGWVALGRLQAGERVCATRASSGVADAGTPTAGGTTSARTSRSNPSARSGCTVRSGLRRTAQSRRDMTSTTATRTHWTTASATLSACLAASTSDTTAHSGLTQPRAGAGLATSPTSAPRAAQRSCSGSAARAPAADAARSAVVRRDVRDRNARARSVGLFSSPASGTSAASVVSTWQPLGRQSVYCLKVEGEPEYFANGVLVHNCDEIAAWQNGEDALDMMEFGLRLGTRPRHLWTSTPRPNAITRRLAKPGKGRILVRGATNDNAANLAKVFLDKIRIYEGTKLGRQELDGELIDAEEAGIIRRSWLNLWPAGKPLPPFEMIIMSLDTAFTEKTIDKSNDPDPTACGVWGLFRIKQQAHVLLLDCWEDHLGLPDLVRKVKKEIEYRYGDDNDQALITPLYGSGKPVTSGRKPDVLLIEDKGSGISLRQTMAELGVDAWAYNPGRADKLSRLHIVSPVFAQRRVWVPESSKLPGKPMTWAEGLIGQLCTFAGEGSIKHDDHVDQTTQALRVMMDKGMLSLVRPAKQQDVAATPPAKPVENPYAV